MSWLKIGGLCCAVISLHGMFKNTHLLHAKNAKLDLRSVVAAKAVSDAHATQSGELSPKVKEKAQSILQKHSSADEDIRRDSSFCAVNKK